MARRLDEPRWCAQLRGTPIRRGYRRGSLFNELSANFTHRGVLITHAAAAADSADELTTFHERNAAWARNDRRIERADERVTCFVSVIEETCLTTKACRCPRLALRNVDGRDWCALHLRKMNKLAVGNIPALVRAPTRNATHRQT
jgi:hypothetical protein